MVKLTTKILFRLERDELWNNLPEGIVCHKEVTIKRRFLPDKNETVFDLEKTRGNIETYLKEKGIIQQHQYIRYFGQCNPYGTPDVKRYYEVCEDVEV